jgi:hypothetical protein
VEDTREIEEIMGNNNDDMEEIRQLNRWVPILIAALLFTIIVFTIVTYYSIVYR